MSEIIVGLSGHIDHGKTSIIKSLTDEFSGSLKEDSKRGMTIDLGIAFLNNKITLIDVPGHEDFVKNMLSGIQSVDVGLLVIAADDGIMPQTIEHFNILKLLNVSKLIVLINKIDLVDQDMIELVHLEIIELLQNTKFEHSDIIKISTINGAGIENLKKILKNISDSNFHKDSEAPFRVPIDRFFSIKGFGTIITGTVLSGNIRIGNEVCIQPIDKLVKIRGLNNHNNSVDCISAGQRAAINLQNINISELKRGYQITSPNSFNNTTSIIAKIQVLDNSIRPINKNQRIRIHLGTAEVIGKIFLFDEKEIKNGDSSIALINLEQKIVSSYRDKFIIRHYSPVFTIGGGEIIIQSENKNDFFNSSKIKLSTISTIVNELKNINDDAFIEFIISNYNQKPVLLEQFANQLGYFKPQLLNFLKNYENIIVIAHLNKTWLLTNKQLLKLKNQIIDFIKMFLKENSYSSSINKEIIISQLDINSDFIDYLLLSLEKEKKIEKKHDGWAIFKYNVKLTKNDESNKEMIVDILNQEGLSTSSVNDLLFKCNIQDKKTFNNLIKICESEDLIIKINESILISTYNINLLKDRLNIFFKTHSSITVSEFKDLVKISRKYAIPILEYLDKINFTYRQGNERKILK